MVSGSFSFDAEQVFKNVCVEGESKFLQASFPKGKVLGKHCAKQVMLFVVLEGAVRFECEGEVRTMTSMDYVLVEPGTEHAVEALENTKALMTLIPKDRAPLTV